MDPALETDVRNLVEAGRHDVAAERTIKGYGPELYGFLVAFHRDAQDAGDVFSLVAENVWRGLPTFSWECSLRAWCYTIARNASYRFRKVARREAARKVGVDDTQAEKLAAQVRTETRSFLQTAAKDRFALLRASLSPADQALLILRVDRKLGWDELARIMLAGETDEDATDPGSPTMAPSAAELARESARLRKRFQLVKEKLRKMGEEAGLLPKKE